MKKPLNRKRSVHRQVSAHLANSDDDDLSILGLELGALHGCRKAADYDMDDPIPDKRENAEDTYRRAKKVVEKILKKSRNASH